MNFYRRSLQDGRFEVICTRCFDTVGAALESDELRKLEDRHKCTGRNSLAGSQFSSEADIRSSGGAFRFLGYPRLRKR